MSGKYQPDKSTSGTEAVLLQFADLIVSRMEEMRAKGAEWQKEWFTVPFNDIPRNISGRPYSASNAFLLQLLTQCKRWDVPVYMTFNQAHDFGASILKGQKSWPVIYWNLSIKDENGRPVEPKKYKEMTEAQRAKCTVIPFLKYYRVFNVSQTNLADVKPELVAKLKEQYAPVKMPDANGMYVNEAIDRMVQNNEWVYPIHPRKSEGAFYSPANDYIQVPLKEQFIKSQDADKLYLAGQSYYSTMLHEMAHSTGHASRLNRIEKARFGDEKYAKEELVAEFTSALTGQSMGFRTEIADNNAAYLNSWVSVLKEEPRFVCSVLADVDKASKMIFEHVDKQRIALGQQPYRSETKGIEKGPTEELAEMATVFTGLDNNLHINVPGYKNRKLTNDESQLWNRFTSEADREKLTKQFTGTTTIVGEALPMARQREMSHSLSV